MRFTAIPVLALLYLGGIGAAGPVASASESGDAATASGARPSGSQDGSGTDDAVSRGEYIARAADCMSCHAGVDGQPYAGGRPIGTPLGDIVASNITSSSRFGIGDYDVDDLRAVLRDGKAPGRKLYPAMPYPAYHDMEDEDIAALYDYLMTVPAVDEAPERETDLDFPFDMRFLMYFWNAVNLGDADDDSALDATERRGRYLVDTLGHCGTCHTPRNAMMATADDEYLSGAVVDGWYAPNITADATAGIGTWTRGEIVEFLRTGHGGDFAQAVGPMGEVVSRSTHHLTDEDRLAMASYLKTVPGQGGDPDGASPFPPPGERTRHVHEVGQIRRELGDALERVRGDGAEALYLRNCASCHGVDGGGQTSAYYPALAGNSGVRRQRPDNLIKVIASGAPYRTLPRTPLMPGFEGELSRQQIADVSSYVRARFGSVSGADVDVRQVDAVLDGRQQELPALIRYAPLLAWSAIALFLALVAWIAWIVVRRART